MRKQDEKPVVYVFFGLIASGKSTFAQAWARYLDIGYYNSDIVRKKLAGKKESGGKDASYKNGIYSEAYTRKTYEALLAEAGKELGRGRSVVLDASYSSRKLRAGIRKLAKKYGVRVQFILCSCPETEIKKRLAIRERDPKAISDGRWEIYLIQKKVFEEPTELPMQELLSFSTLGPVEVLVERLAEELKE